ncbi:HEAT repeat-containing protein 3 [Odontomachus brunneus]|uniref:HEAT repeat-containing protein 3 n=1 Tax=Odontomachus brunneus TaxID=486640 RepID=UPI0013F28100|nr:HEAT repeat-containing protein 3 [Odontomachus brunneus]
MGKQKRQREKLHKKNPTGLPSVKDFDEIEDIREERKTALLDIYNEIQSCNIKEQLSALQTLEAMACDPSMAEYIAKDGIVKIIGPLLLHYNSAVRASTASTLRQIAESYETKTVICLIKDDIMTPLSALLKQYYSNWIYKWDRKDATPTDEEQTYIQALHLLRTLCENDENAVKCVNEQNLVPILTKYLDINSYETYIILITMKCLLTVAEDNIDAVMAIKSRIGILQDIITVEDANSKEFHKLNLLKILSFDMLSNICNSDDVWKPTYINSFIKTLDEVLSVDNKQLLSDLVSILPHESNAASTSKKKKIEESKLTLITQQYALETLTNLSSDDNDEDDENADVDDSEEIDMNSDPMDVDNASENVRSFPIGLVEAFNNCNVIGKIWEKSIQMDSDSEEILNQTAEGKFVLGLFYGIWCRAYLCLNNLLPNFNIDTLGGIDYLYSKWLEVGKVVAECTKPDKLKLLDAAIFVMRAIIERLTCIQANVFIRFNKANLQLILNNEIQTRNADENIRVNMMRILGILALNLTRTENLEAYEIAKQITEIILDSCMGETRVWVLAETMDVTMDLFAEDETDKLAYEVQLIQRLRPLVPVFKDKVRQQKDKLKDRMAVVSTVNTNIWRFLKYKEKQIRRFK